MPVIAHGDGAGIDIEGELDGGLPTILDELGFAIRIVGGLGPHDHDLVDRIRGVRYQLAQEDFLGRVDGVDDNIQNLLALGLKLVH